MSDRELLEAAAKAAGIDIEWQSGAWAHNNETGCEWNPLTDDGDALRLAVKLDLSSLVIWNHPSGGKRREFWSPNSGHDGGRSATTEAEYANDPYAATRRAIVRAAAEIGKEMK